MNQIKFISFQLPINTIECNRFPFLISNKNTSSLISTSFYFSLFILDQTNLFYLFSNTQQKSNNKKTCLFNKKNHFGFFLLRFVDRILRRFFGYAVIRKHFNLCYENMQHETRKDYVIELEKVEVKREEIFNFLIYCRKHMLCFYFLFVAY